MQFMQLTRHWPQHFDVYKLLHVLLEVDEVGRLTVAMDLADFDVIECRVRVEQLVAEERDAPWLLGWVVQDVVFVLSVIGNGSDLK